MGIGGYQSGLAQFKKNWDILMGMGMGWDGNLESTSSKSTALRC